MTDMGKVAFGVVCVVGVVTFLSPAFATEQVYHPVSPTFGGNPSNGPFLLSVAQAQGEGAKSGNQGPDLSGLAAALSGNGNGSGSSGGGALPGMVANPTGG